MLSLLFFAAVQTSAVDAEIAFARDARRLGQWTAFRKYADPDAVMFTPQVVWAHEFLAGRKNPPAAVRWWPAQSYVSCDGRIAVNTGPAAYAGGRGAGYFTTVWQRERRRWRWVYDAGDALKVARPIPKRPFVRKASCAGKPTRRAVAVADPVVEAPRQGPARRLWRRPLGGRHAGLGLEGRRKGRAAIPHLPVERRALRAGHPRPHRPRQWLGTSVDRAVRLGFGHLPGDHRPAGLRADFRQPDARHFGGAPPRDGGAIVVHRVGDPDVLRFARQADAACARHQPGQLPRRRGRDAVHDRARHGVRAAHEAARGPRLVDRRDAGGRGHFGLPDGHADDQRAGIDRQRDAVGVARRGCARRSRRCSRRSPSSC